MHTTKTNETTFLHNRSGLPEGEVTISNENGELTINAADLRSFMLTCIINEKIAKLEQIDDLEKLIQ